MYWNVGGCYLNDNTIDDLEIGRYSIKILAEFSFLLQSETSNDLYTTNQWGYKHNKFKCWYHNKSGNMYIGGALFWSL